jgi:hypothetical protein
MIAGVNAWLDFLNVSSRNLIAWFLGRCDNRKMVDHVERLPANLQASRLASGYGPRTTECVLVGRKRSRRTG